MTTPSTLTSFNRLPDARRGAMRKRLNRLTGHLLGIGRMMERGESCDAILLQITAVRAALGSLSGELLDEHLECCIGGISGSPQALKAFRQTVKRMIKTG